MTTTFRLSTRAISTMMAIPAVIALTAGCNEDAGTVAADERSAEALILSESSLTSLLRTETDDGEDDEEGDDLSTDRPIPDEDPECAEICPAGPPGPPGPAGEAGPPGQPAAPLDRNAVYNVLSYRGPGGDATFGTVFAPCASANDILLNCTCQGSSHLTAFIDENPYQPLADVTLVPLARNFGPGSEVPDQCLCQSAGAEPDDVIAAVATCISATPLCDGEPPASFGEICGGQCGIGTVGCDGSCDADPGPADAGENCVYAECACGDIQGIIDCNGNCMPLTPLSSCCLFCGGYCPPF